MNQRTDVRRTIVHSIGLVIGYVYFLCLHFYLFHWGVGEKSIATIYTYLKQTRMLTQQFIGIDQSGHQNRCGLYGRHSPGSQLRQRTVCVRRRCAAAARRFTRRMLVQHIMLVFVLSSRRAAIARDDGGVGAKYCAGQTVAARSTNGEMPFQA